ncbi:helix-turn-helix transcriptional regulator [Bradyrhizobium sp. Arg62]|uniref:helix-turn-helix domain-containing protein n=1 Tax=Bradyrhizobium brasilense TaxID=1419277 RepID=UPI001E4D2679|nr:AraC family transcriptional regulator [Bradyrhizobium brasilense]MCC8943582.1 helix-turn-helix transcriptional regulator [Bradyrhizobium brasilense]
MLKSLDERQIEPLMLLLRPSVAEGYPETCLPQSLTADVVDRADATPSQGFIRGGLPPRVLRRIREHIDANIDQRISVEALARLANLSVCYFVRAFKQSAGLTPHDYLIRRRVERTMEMLSRTNLSLSEIALAAGFADQSHCARRFRQHVGMSPRDYRWLIP